MKGFGTVQCTKRRIGRRLRFRTAGCVPGGWESKERTTGHKVAIQYVVRMVQ